MSASILASSGTPVTMIQDILRHNRLSTTEKYVKTLDAPRPFLKVLRRKRSENVSQNVQKQEAPKGATFEASTSS